MIAFGKVICPGCGTEVQPDPNPPYDIEYTYWQCRVCLWEASEVGIPTIAQLLSMDSYPCQDVDLAKFLQAMMKEVG